MEKNRSNSSKRASGTGQAGPGKVKKWLKKPWVITLVSFIFLISLILIVVFVAQVNNYRKLINLQNDWRAINLTKGIKEQKQVFLKINDNFQLGSEDPEVTIVKFSDFTCPYCHNMSIKLRNIVSAYPDRVKLVYKDYPLVNEEGMDFALAARCAGEQNRMFFWLMHDELFNKQGLISPKDLPTVADYLGLDIEDFNQCLDNETLMNEVKADALEGDKAGVEATPTLFINGYIVRGDIPEAVLNKIVQEFLEDGS